MGKPRRIDLNKWERVDSLDDLENYQSLIITPFKLKDGTQPPELYFRKGVMKHNEIVDVSDVEWTKDIRISKEGGDDEYAIRVDWWFDNASTNEEYRQLINSSFNKNGFDVKKNWNMAQNYLKKFNYSSRKTYIHKYVWNWLTSSMHRHLKFKR